MIKEIYLIGDWPLSSEPAPDSKILKDRSYFRFHSQEVAQVWRPWLRKYESYSAYNAPKEADLFGVKRYRMTEAWLDSLDAYRECYAIRPTFTGITHLFSKNPSVRGKYSRPKFNVAPDHFFVDAQLEPEEKPIMRWVRAFRYPNGVSLAEGEKWYLKIHSQEMKKQPGILRYTSHLAIMLDEFTPENVAYHRLEEIWYEDSGAYLGNFASWKKGMIVKAPKFTPPPWDGKKPWVNMNSVFVALKPDVDFLRDHPRIP